MARPGALALAVDYEVAIPPSCSRARIDNRHRAATSHSYCGVVRGWRVDDVTPNPVDN